MFNWFKKEKFEVPPWHLAAQNEIGVREIAGPVDNPRIVEYHKATTLKASDDETPWCSSFVCWCLEVSGIKSTRSAAARSYLQFGKPVKLSEARVGDIVVFKRGNNGWSGHVCFFVKYENGYLHCLGGNQDNRVKIGVYGTGQLLGIRRVIQ